MTKNSTARADGSMRTGLAGGPGLAGFPVHTWVSLVALWSLVAELAAFALFAGGSWDAHWAGLKLNWPPNV